MMELTTVVQFSGAPARYLITDEGDGIYLACLQQYDGPGESGPPRGLLLVRGIRRWLGSTDAPWLADDLGAAIDEALRKHNQVFFGRAPHETK